MKSNNFTDDQYIPIKDLAIRGEKFVESVNEYRSNFIEVINIDGIDFAYLTETPTLLKARYSKNVDLKGNISEEFESNDYILEIAKSIVRKKKLKTIKIPNQQKLLMKFKENGNDLTIITQYISSIIDQVLEEDIKDMGKAIPELSTRDIKFIKVNNNIRMSYTIEDYRMVNNCVYETARKSLDRLVEIGLYIKEKISKRFIYKPTEKLARIMKGSE